MRGLNPDQLKAFLEVLELGSFTAAAKKLNLSQPAVSLQIRELEAKCGVPLLDRNGRRPLATAAGRLLVVHARRIMAESDEALSAMLRMKSSAQGIIRLGMTTPTLTYLVREGIRQVRRDIPDSVLALTLAPSRRLVDQVREGEVDMAIVSMPLDPTNLDVHIIASEQVVGIVGESIVPPGTAVTPERLSTRAFYVQGNPDVQMTHALAWFRSAGLSPQAWVEVETLEACCAAAAAGLGATIAPASMAACMIRPEHVFSLEPRITRTIALISRSDLSLGKSTKDIANILTLAIESAIAAAAPSASETHATPATVAAIA